MAVIGELATLVTARTAPFEKAMKRARGATTSFQMSLKNAAVGVASFGGAMAAIRQSTAIARRGFELVTEELQRIDELAKVGARLNIDFTSLTALKGAADEAGISFGAVEKAFQRMEKQIGNAQRGVGESIKIFEELGLNADELANLSAFEQFAAITQKIGEMDTHTQRLSATIKIFESEGADMVRMLALGEEGLAAAVAKARLFGNTLDEKTVKNIEATNDALGDLSEITGSIKTGFAVELSSAFRDIAEIAKVLGVELKPGSIGALLGSIVRSQLTGPIGGLALEGTGGLAQRVNENRLAKQTAIERERLFPGQNRTGAAPIVKVQPTDKIDREQPKQTRALELSVGFLRTIAERTVAGRLVTTFLD